MFALSRGVSLAIVTLALSSLTAADDVPIEEQPSDPSLAKIVLIAGPKTPKLKPGEHEYLAGCALLRNQLRQTPGVFPVVVEGGWPKNPETLTRAKAVVLFLEGGDVHPLLKDDRLKTMLDLESRKVGIVHLHSAIDYPKDFNDRTRTLAGAAWEKGYSQRAHWVSTFETFPDHPIFRGVSKFTIDDGWLWKLRFTPERTGITPLLKTRSPKDMKTSDADAVVAWAYDRPQGGRSFSFTGGHLHESFKQDGYRRFLVNGILWSAGIEIPKDGAPIALDPVDLQRPLTTKP